MAKTVKHTIKERKAMRALKRRSGPSGLRRKERRAHLQPVALETK